MDNKSLSDLIGLIYEAASDADQWSNVLEALATEMDALLEDDAAQDAQVAAPPRSAEAGAGGKTGWSGPGHPPGDARDLRVRMGSPGAKGDWGERLDRLLRPHVCRALSINRQLFDARDDRDALQSLWNRLPLGIALVDAGLRVLASNARLDALAAEGPAIRVRDGVLIAESSNDSAKLRALVRETISSHEARVRTVRLPGHGGTEAISASIVRWTQSPIEGDGEPSKALVFLTSPQLYTEISIDVLCSIYKLTKAEAKLVAALVDDLSPATIAERFGLSKHTIRTQLRAVYQKTGTHRQAELVRQVLAGPAMVATLSAGVGGAVPRRPCASHFARLGPKANQTLRLPDGRTLGFAEYGAADGMPAILMHSVFGSRFQRHPEERIAKVCRVRLIVPERPGTGLSDPKPTVSLREWADDIACLADHLALRNFGVIGYSMGGAFAAGCAHALKGRVRRLTLVCSTRPFGDVRSLHGMYPPFRVLLSLGRSAPTLLAPLLKLLLSQLSLEKLQSDVAAQMPALDRALLYDDAMREAFSQDMQESVRQGVGHILPEVLAICGDWGFSLRDLEVPVSLWHGQQDRIVPLHLIEDMARSLPACRTTYVPRAGHHLLFHCWRDILLDAAFGTAASSAALNL